MTPKFPGERRPMPRRQEPIEPEADYQRRTKEAREWFAQKKHLEPIRGKKP